MKTKTKILKIMKKNEYYSQKNESGGNCGIQI
jgi:hypothetical protein